MTEYRTKYSPVFKWHSTTGPFGNQTTLDHSNTRLVQYSDPTVPVSIFQILSIVLNKNYFNTLMLAHDLHEI